MKNKCEEIEPEYIAKLRALTQEEREDVLNEIIRWFIKASLPPPPTKTRPTLTLITGGNHD